MLKKVKGYLSNDRADASITIFSVFAFIGILGFMVFILGFAAIHIDSVIIKNKVHQQLNNLSVQISTDAYLDIKEQNSATYLDSFLDHKQDYTTHFKTAVNAQLPETEYYRVDPDSIHLEYLEISGDAVTYQATMDIQFRLSMFGGRWIIHSTSAKMQGTHSFKQGSDAVDQAQGDGNQNGDVQLE